MIFSPITEKVHKREKAQYINDNIDISANEYSLPMPPTSFIMHQGALSPSCVAHAVTMAVMVAIKMQTNKWVKLSPFSLHGYTDNEGGGTQSWYIAEALCRFGILPASVFSARGDNPKLHEALVTLIKKNPSAEKFARHYKGVAYAELDNFDDVKRAIKCGYPVVGAVKVGKNFGSNGGIEPVYPKNTTTWHEIEFNGWCVKNGVEYLIAINSHGKYSGDKGKVYIPRGRLLKDLTLIDFKSDHIKKKSQRIELRIGEHQSYIKNNRTYLPVRFVAENLGADVEWDAQNGVATIKSEEAIIKLATNSNVITIDGKQKYMDVPPQIVNGRMMLPIRHIAEALNCTIDWCADQQKAVITAL